MRVLPPDDDDRSPSGSGIRAVVAVVLVGVGFAALYLGLRADESDSIPPDAAPVVAADEAEQVRPATVEGRAVEPKPPDGDGDVSLPEGLSAVAATWDGSRFWALAVAQPPGEEPPRERALLLAIDPVTDEVLSETPLGDAPGLIAASPGAVWVAHWHTGDLSRVDPETGEVTSTISPQLPFDVGAGPDSRRFVPGALAIADGSVWMLTARGAIAQVDAASGELVAVHTIGHTVPGAMAVDGQGVWITQSAGDALVRLDPGSGLVEPMIGERSQEANAVAVESGIVLVAGDTEPTDRDGPAALTIFDPGKNELLGGIPFPELIRGFARIGGDFGLLDQVGSFYPIDPVSRTVLSPFGTNWSGGELFEADGGTWMIDGGRLRRLAVTGELPAPLAYAIADETEPRPIPPEAALSPDWEPLADFPFPERWPAVVAWTGTEIVLWGGEPVGGGSGMATGAAYDPATDTWREIATAPVPSIEQSQASWVWTGDELVVWTRDAYAWNPDTDTWRVIEDWPLPPNYYRRAVWTGTEIIDIDGGLGVDPVTGASRPIADPPTGFDQRTSVVWGQGLVVPVPRGPVYEAAADHWLETAWSGLSPNATAGVWTGRRVVAVDYEMQAAAYDPGAGQWSSLPIVPLRFFECAPRAHEVRGKALVEHCSGYALLDQDDRWQTLAHPDVTAPPSWTVSTGDAVYAWTGSAFARLRNAALDGDIRRRVVNTSILDVPDGWRVVSTGARDEWIQVDVLTPDGLRCVVVGAHVDAATALRDHATESSEVATVDPIVGGTPVEALLIPDDGTALSAGPHVVWATSTTDIYDVSCPTADLALDLAAHVWSPWQ